MYKVIIAFLVISISPVLLLSCKKGSVASVPEVQVPATNKYDIVVAKDGSGTYNTVQKAFDAVPNSSTKRTVIYIKNGTYKEVLTLASAKKNVTIIGESATGVILTYDNYSSKIDPATGLGYGTSGSASTFIRAEGLYAVNITFENSSGPVGQALAISILADKAIFLNCRFLGRQDTIYGDRCRQYFKDCYIEGSTDYIFGPSTAFFEKCTLYNYGGSAITAASTESYVTYGYVFSNCKIESEAGKVTTLGRPWRPYAAVAYLNCTINSSIKAAGWDNWGNPENEKTARYSEYNNTGPGALLTSRPAWIKRLTEAEASQYTVSNILGTTYANPGIKDSWNPLTVIESTGAAAK